MFWRVLRSRYSSIININYATCITEETFRINGSKTRQVHIMKLITMKKRSNDAAQS